MNGITSAPRLLANANALRGLWIVTLRGQTRDAVRPELTGAFAARRLDNALIGPDEAIGALPTRPTGPTTTREVALRPFRIRRFADHRRDVVCGVASSAGRAR
jgi:hypothetical protein